jgi:hypothetical protein
VDHGVGVGGGQAGECAGQKEPASAGEGGDGDLGAAAAELIDLLLGVCELRGDRLGSPDHDPAGRGQGDSAGTARDDLGTEAALECGDVLGDG